MRRANRCGRALSRPPVALTKGVISGMGGCDGYSLYPPAIISRVREGHHTPTIVSEASRSVLMDAATRSSDSAARNNQSRSSLASTGKR
jgi:hypothetical protein